MRSACLIFSSLLVLVTAPARGAQTTAAKVTTLRELSGNVDVVQRGGAPLPAYLDRLDAALWLEQASGTASPYAVSIANSLEALDSKEREGRGDALLLRAYLLLAQFSGPQAGRLMGLYTAGLAHLVGAKPDEVTVTAEMQRDLRQIGAYAAAGAGRLVEKLPAAERPEAQTQLLLAQGRYAQALKAAKAWAAASPSALSRAHLLGAQLLAGQAAAAAPLRELERDGLPGAHAAWQLLRRAAREALVARLGKALTAPGAAPDVRKAATAWGKPEEPPVRDACQLVLKQEGAKDPPLADCLVILLESPDGEWVRHPAVAAAEEGKDPAGRRLVLLRLAAQLGALLGLPGRGPEKDSADRARALEEVTRLAPAAQLPPEEAEALLLLAQIGAAQKPEVPAHLQPAVDKFVKAHPCSPLGLPLYLARYQPPQRAAVLAEALGRCSGDSARDAEAQRQLAMQVLALSPAGPASDAAFATLERLGKGAAPGGRLLLNVADGAALRLFGRKGPAPDDAALAAAQKRYADAAAALTPWDGPEARGRAEVQQAALALRRYALQARPELLEEAAAHLRWAILLPVGDTALEAQALSEALSLEQARRDKKPVTAPQADLSRVPGGPGRRALACVLAAEARAAKDTAAAARYAALAAPEPLPEIASSGQVRLTTSLHVDERLRVGTRGELSVAVMPRCSGR